MAPVNPMPGEASPVLIRDFEASFFEPFQNVVILTGVANSFTREGVRRGCGASLQRW